MHTNKVMQQALDAFDLHAKQYPHMVKGYTSDATDALRAALAQPEGEPAYRCNPYSSVPGAKVSDPVDYYTHPAHYTPPTEISKIQIPTDTMEQEFANYERRGYAKAEKEIAELKAKLEDAVDALKKYDDLIKHNYSGTQDAMSDLTYAAQNGHSVLLKLMKD